MAYYSSVRIAMRKDDFPAFCSQVEQLSDQMGDQWPLISTTIDPPIDIRDNHTIVFGWDNIKWYNDLPEVKSILQALDGMQAENKPYQLCVLGERYEDVEFTDADDNAELTIRIEPYVSFNIYGDLYGNPRNGGDHD